MKKIISIVLVIGLVFSFSIISFASTNNLQTTSLDKDEANRFTDNVEKEIQTFYSSELEKGYQSANEIIKAQKMNPQSTAALKIVEQKISDHFRIAVQKEKSYLMQNGWELIKQPKTNTVEISSSSSNLQMNENLYFNYSSGLFRYAGIVEFTEYDDYYDIEDIMSVRAEQEITIYSGYGYTYDISGMQTGFDNNGNNDSNSLINKRYENKHGYVWNVIDIVDYFGYSIPQTKIIKTSLYFTPDVSISTQKFFTDYEHNYKTFEFTSSASISTSSLTSVGLNVSYTSVNKRWPRTSTGIFLNQAQ